MATQLYDRYHVEIYPVVLSNSVMIPEKDDNGKETQKPSNINLSSKLDELTNNHESDIKKLEDQIAELTGDKEAVTNITVSVKYVNTNISSQNEILLIPLSEWSTNFLIPDSKNLYTWKRTEIKVAEVSNVFYEIVATGTLNETQIIYKNTSSAEQPVISLPTFIQDGETIVDYNLINKDDYIPNGWSKYPQAITSALPNAYMAIREKKNGKWQQKGVDGYSDYYEGPFQYGKWTYNGIIKSKYIITEVLNVPGINLSKEDPSIENFNWSDSITEDFTGYLWMTTATSINDEFQSVNNIIWSNPTLISIVK